MYNPMIFWYLVVGAVLVSFLIHLIQYLYSQYKETHVDNSSLLDLVKDEDLLFIPGDRHFNDDDDFDDI